MPYILNLWMSFLLSWVKLKKFCAQLILEVKLYFDFLIKKINKLVPPSIKKLIYG